MLLSLIGGWQRYAVYGALGLAVGGMCFGYGYHRGIRNLWEYQAEQARAAIPVIVKQGAVTEKVVTKYRDRIVRVKGDTVTLTKEVTVYVPASADPVLPAGWLLLHDAAATTSSVPPAPDGIDVAAPAIAASQALKGVIGNYGVCYETGAQLVTLQEWIREQYRTTNLEELGY